MIQKYRDMRAPQDFDFYLFDFVSYMGFSRNCSSTNTIKFPLAADLLKNIKKDSEDLCILIPELEEGRVEDKKEISWRMGDGLSLLLAEKIYNLEKNKISKIRRRSNESKPDYQGFCGNTKVVWEAKGSINPPQSTVINTAQDQKLQEPSNVAFASFATLKSDCISEVTLKDPPNLPLEGNELAIKSSKARHYVDVFNFIGQPELSRYFLLMEKRLRYDRDFREYIDKE